MAVLCRQVDTAEPLSASNPLLQGPSVPVGQGGWLWGFYPQAPDYLIPQSCSFLF